MENSVGFVLQLHLCSLWVEKVSFVTNPEQLKWSGGVWVKLLGSQTVFSVWGVVCQFKN